MTCNHVLAIIDALVFASPHQLEFVQKHIRNCTSCRSALATAEALDAQLSQLYEPVPPPSLAPVIRASTVQENQKRAALRLDRPCVAPARSRSNRAPWAATLVGVALGLGAQAYRLIMGESVLHLTSPVLSHRTGDLIDMLHGGSAVLVLAAGLLLCTAGLFEPRRI